MWTDAQQIVREKQADEANDGVGPSTTAQVPNHTKTDGAADSKPKRGRTMGLSAPGMKLSRSHSRHSAVTDKGQVEVPMEDLSKIVSAPPGLAEATVLAPERSASPLPSPRSELNNPPPGIVVSDNPMSPDTLIPATDTLSTRYVTSMYELHVRHILTSYTNVKTYGGWYRISVQSQSRWTGRKGC
jgi:hypothetical protein